MTLQPGIDLRGWGDDDAGLVSGICQEQISEAGDDDDLVVRNRSQRWGMTLGWLSGTDLRGGG